MKLICVIGVDGSDFWELKGDSFTLPLMPAKDECPEGAVILNAVRTERVRGEEKPDDWLSVGFGHAEDQIARDVSCSRKRNIQVYAWVCNTIDEFVHHLEKYEFQTDCPASEEDLELPSAEWLGYSIWLVRLPVHIAAELCEGYLIDWRDSYE